MDDYDKQRAGLETANLPLLHGFHQYLIDRRTGKRASCGHIDRLAFFANVYLLDYHEKSLADGYDEVSDYLGHWFIRKAMWSDVGALDENIETFRKFYAYLRSAGHIDEARFKELVETIKTPAPSIRSSSPSPTARSSHWSPFLLRFSITSTASRASLHRPRRVPPSAWSRASPAA
jgi:hypothetical protein